MKYERKRIGKDKAIELAKSEWWVGKPAREIAMFQMFTAELAMPFSVFHEALEKALGRPVWTHELGLNYDGLCSELLGEKPTPSMEDIVNLIPAEKRLVVTL